MDEEVPDSTTLCRFHNVLVKSGVYDSLLSEVNRWLEARHTRNGRQGYDSAENKETLSRMKLKSRIMHKTPKNRCLIGWETAVSKAISKLRYAVKRTFGSMHR